MADRAVLAAVAGTLLGCGPRAPEAPAQGGLVEFLAVNGMVLDATVAQPICPVRPHFTADIQVSGMSGRMTYRWERSTGEHSKDFTVSIPASKDGNPVPLTLEPDEFLDTMRGVQMQYTNRIHILPPIERYSPQVEVAAKCYASPK